MPNDVIGQSDDLVSRSFRHFSEPFCFRLVLKSVARKINSFGNDQLTWMINRLGGFGLPDL